MKDFKIKYVVVLTEKKAQFGPLAKGIPSATRAC
jgi:hypothetical protein